MSKEPKKILVVEDEEPLRKLYVDVLQDEGFSVSAAENGKKGLELALKEKPDLILLDILMPVMNGMVMMKKLREDVWGKKVAIILLTNLSATDENIVKGMIEDEPSYFLVKTEWSVGDITDKIKKILGIKN
jgi:two-component system alkaline phosphatase synthesis response regulator PhoP